MVVPQYGKYNPDKIAFKSEFTKFAGNADH